MSIIMKKQPDTLADRMLRRIGKERAYVLPRMGGTLGPHVYALVEKESFWSALFRPKGAPLSVGLISSRQIDELLAQE